MRLQAVLALKTTTGKRVLRYRIYCPDTEEMKDYSVEIVREVLKRGVNIEGLRLKDDSNIIETANIKKINLSLAGHESLETWCKARGTLGKEILAEFNNGGNWPIMASDLCRASNQKVGFKCKHCGMINTMSVVGRTIYGAKCECEYLKSKLSSDSLDTEVNKILEETLESGD